MRAALPSCDAGPPPCWRLDPNPVFCPGAPELALDRDADWCPALPATLSVSCVGCLDPGAPACAGGSASP